MSCLRRLPLALVLVAALGSGCACQQGFFVQSSELRTVPGGALVLLRGLTHPIGMNQDQIESSVASIAEHRARTVALVITMPGPSATTRVRDDGGGSGYVGELWHERHRWRVGPTERRLEATIGRDGMVTVGESSLHLSGGTVFLIELRDDGTTNSRQLVEELEIATLRDPIKTLAARHPSTLTLATPSERGDALFRHVGCGRMSETTARGLARVAERMARLPDNPLADRHGYARALDDEQQRWMCAVRELTVRESLRVGMAERDAVELLGSPTQRDDGVLRWQFDSSRMVNPYLDAHVEAGGVRRLETGID